jgi:hypothetical protein
MSYILSATHAVNPTATNIAACPSHTTAPQSGHMLAQIAAASLIAALAAAADLIVRNTLLCSNACASLVLFLTQALRVGHHRPPE